MNMDNAEKRFWIGELWVLTLLGAIFLGAGIAGYESAWSLVHMTLSFIGITLALLFIRLAYLAGTRRVG